MSKSISLVLSGYYGFGNAGDEAVLMSILQQLKQNSITPIVLSSNPHETTKTYGVEAVDRMKLTDVAKAIKESDGLISGGGSLLQDVTSVRNTFYYLGVMKIAQWYKKPVFCYAQGIGPLRRKWIHPFVRAVLNRCEFISVRDPHSQTLLEKIGVTKPIVLSADPALNFQQEGMPQLADEMHAILMKRPLVLALRNWDNGERAMHQMVALIHKLRTKQIPVLLLPFHTPHDGELAARIKQAFEADDNVVVAKNIKNAQDFVYIINNGYVMVGMRLHALVFAASQRIPFIGISYDPKIDAFMELFEGASATNTEEWNGEAVYEKIMWTYAHYDEEIQKINTRLVALGEQTYRPMAYITNFFKEELHDTVTRDSLFHPNNERKHRNIK